MSAEVAGARSSVLGSDLPGQRGEEEEVLGR